MTQFGSHIKIDRYHRSNIKICKVDSPIKTYCIDDAETRNGQYSDMTQEEIYGESGLDRARVKWESQQSDFQHKSWFKFDYSHLLGNNVTSAIFKMSVIDVTVDADIALNINVEMWDIADSWDEETITWDNEPTLDSKLSSHNVTWDDVKNNGPYIINWDVTTIFNNALSANGIFSLGFWLPVASTNGGIIIATKEHDNPDYFPKIVYS